MLPHAYVPFLDDEMKMVFNVGFYISLQYMYIVQCND
jgi:hypothetical protein